MGIAGIGFMGSTHFGIYKEHPLAKVVAIADVDLRKREGDWSSIAGNIDDEAESDKVDLQEIRCYATIEELISDDKIDLIDICVPTHLHFRHASHALKTGKHVLCEKPLARTVEEAAELLQLASTSKGFFSVGMCIRYWPEYSYARRLYHSGTLGAVKSAYFRRISGNIAGNAWNNWFMNAQESGGALLDLHIHDIDAVRYFFGRPTALQSFALQGFRSDTGVDHCMTVYDYEDGSLIYSDGSWSPAAGTPFDMSFLIVCEKGTMQFTQQGLQIFMEDGSQPTPDLGDPHLPTGWHREIDYILTSIRQGRPPYDYLPLSEMADAMCMVQTAEQSIVTGRKQRITYL